jgi:hypothetical protein
MGYRKGRVLVVSIMQGYIYAAHCGAMEIFRKNVEKHPWTSWRSPPCDLHPCSTIHGHPRKGSAMGSTCLLCSVTQCIFFGQNHGDGEVFLGDLAKWSYFSEIQIYEIFHALSRCLNKSNLDGKSQNFLLLARSLCSLATTISPFRPAWYSIENCARKCGNIFLKKLGQMAKLGSDEKNTLVWPPCRKTSMDLYLHAPPSMDILEVTSMWPPSMLQPPYPSVSSEILKISLSYLDLEIVLLLLSYRNSDVFEIWNLSPAWPLRRILDIKGEWNISLKSFEIRNQSPDLCAKFSPRRMKYSLKSFKIWNDLLTSGWYLAPGLQHQ